MHSFSVSSVSYFLDYLCSFFCSDVFGGEDRQPGLGLQVGAVLAREAAHVRREHTGHHHVAGERTRPPLQSEGNRSLYWCVKQPTYDVKTLAIITSPGREHARRCNLGVPFINAKKDFINAKIVFFIQDMHKIQQLTDKRKERIPVAINGFNFFSVWVY